MGLASVPASASLLAGAGGPVQADRTSILFCRQGNVHRCREFRSNSKIKVRRCESFWLRSTTNFGHLHLVKFTSLMGLAWYDFLSLILLL